MASTITAATMTVKLTETISLNGQNQGSSNTFTIASINEVYKRIVTCIAGVDTTVARFGAQVDITDSSLDIADTKYIRVTNLDDTESVNVNLQIDTTESGSGASAVNETATILLAAGQSLIMGTGHDSIAVYDADGSVQTTLHDLESILIDPGSNNVDVEVFIASV
tara:strand:+ start:1440 stop:1937 length:498 start_codon:yes stop_codon:yes gene_type:complete